MTPEEEIMEMLISAGAMELIGIDSEGGPLYVFTPKLKDIMPDLYEEHISYINQQVMNLWDKGFVEVKFEDNGEFMVSITENALDEAELSKLSKEERWSVEELKRITRKS